ncbi:MAG TPA: NucA/NucB deoxyribonuclease domain-containing protein [Kribbella sp.]
MNRSKACAGFQPNYGDSCDEYPFASSVEGGGGAQTQEVPLREQLCQGGTLRRQYQAQEINDGSEFAVVVIDLAAIPSGPYKGTDIARGAGTSC